MDAVSETVREPWDTVLRWTAVEFLNVLAYRKDKAAMERSELDKWRQSN